MITDQGFGFKEIYTQALQRSTADSAQCGKGCNSAAEASGSTIKTLTYGKFCGDGPDLEVLADVALIWEHRSILTFLPVLRTFVLHLVHTTTP